MEKNIKKLQYLYCGLHEKIVIDLDEEGLKIQDEELLRISLEKLDYFSLFEGFEKEKKIQQEINKIKREILEDIEDRVKKSELLTKIKTDFLTELKNNQYLKKLYHERDLITDRKRN